MKAKFRFVLAFILSWVDYCNTVLTGLPASTLALLQRVLNAAAHFMVSSASCTHVSSIMRLLHWLPITYQMQFKLCVLISNGSNRTNPAYLSDTTTSILAMTAIIGSALQWQTSSTSHTQHTRTNFVQSVYCGWTIWMKHYPPTLESIPTCQLLNEPSGHFLDCHMRIKHSMLNFSLLATLSGPCGQF